MNYSFVDCDEVLLKAIGEIRPLLNFDISKDGIPVKLRRTTKGLVLKKTKQEIIIEYDSYSTLFRGIFLMISNAHRDEADIKQDCSFSNLGIMFDVSRNAVLKVDRVKDMVRHLAVLGYHSIQLYTEDILEIEGEEYFGYMRGAYSQDEIREIDDYAKLFGMELIPCVQTLAHMNQITRYERYDSIIDNTDILLAGDEKTYELIESIIKTAANCYTSRNINIGMDEAHMIGLGKYLDRHGYQSRFDIMIEHLKRVTAICEKYGFQAQMWSDMFFRIAFCGDYYSKEMDEQTKGLFAKIPKNLKLIYWDYYSIDDKHYKKNLEIHKSISDNIGFAGGAWKWTGFVPDNAYSLLTGEQSIKACKEANISDFLVTCWGDNGAETSIYSILPSIYFYAEKAYGDFLLKEGFETLTGIAFDDYMKVDLPNRLVSSEYERNNGSKFFLYNDILIGTFDSLVFDGIDKVYLSHAEELQRISEGNNRYSYIFKTMEHLCRVLEIKANLGVRLKNAYDTNDRNEMLLMKDEVLPELNNRIHQFYDFFNQQWHKDNKSFGFEVQCIRLGGLSKRVDYCIERLQKYLNKEISKIEELEVKRKPFNYFNTKDLDKLIYNLWSVIVTPSVL